MCGADQRFYAPLVFSLEEIDRFVAAIEEVLKSGLPALPAWAALLAVTYGNGRQDCPSG
jgi:hypothetical protein